MSSTETLPPHHNPLTWAHGLVREDREPLEFNDHRFLIDPYYDLSPTQVMLKSAQVGGSVMQILKALWAAAYRNMNVIYCADEQTKVLAKRGWLSHQELREGEEILTLVPGNVPGGVKSRWSVVEEVFCAPYRGRMAEMKGHAFDALVTWDHRWLVRPGSRRSRLAFRETRELGRSWIPLAAPFRGRQGRCSWSVDEVEFLAWVFTEGYYVAPSTGAKSIEIVQSHARNPDNVERIRALLFRLGIQTEEYRDDRGCTRFRASDGKFSDGRNSPLPGFTRMLFPLKIPTADFLHALNAPHLERFVETCIAADGHRERTKKGGFFNQRSAEFAHLFALAAVLLGKSVSIHSSKNHGKDYWKVRIRTAKFQDMGSLRIRSIPYRGVVWCPRTRDGTFLAMRNGTVYWTGNTLPSRAVSKEFVVPKVQPLITENPRIRSLVGNTDNESLKKIGDRFVYFRGSFSETEAIAVSADLLIQDEVDRSDANILRTYESRLDASKYGWLWQFSNPSVPGLGVERLWRDSDQKEWVVRCQRGHQEPLRWPESVDLEAARFQCAFCHEPLTNRERKMGEWVARHPEREVSGYHISQLMCPWISAEKILYDRDTATQTYFYNFTLGLPYLAAETHITPQDILNALEPDLPARTRNTAMGVDVGNVKHYVVGSELGVFRVGKTESWDDIERLINLEAVRVCVIDAQPDITLPRQLAEKYPGRVFLNWYVGEQKRKEPAFWDARVPTIKLDRTKAFDDLVFKLRNGDIRFALRAEQLQELIEHCGNVHRVLEESRTGTVARWEHKEGSPDHFCFAAGTMVETERGEFPIESLRTGDRVLTRQGFKPIVAVSARQAEVILVLLPNGRILEGTPDHPVWESGSWRTLDSIDYYATLESCEPWKRLYGTALLSGDIQTRRPERNVSTSAQEALTGNAGLFGSIKRYGSRHMGRFRRGTRFTIAMAIRFTTILKIWRAFRGERTNAVTWQSVFGSPRTISGWRNICVAFVHSLTHGGERALAGSGTGNMRFGVWFSPPALSFAKSAEEKGLLGAQTGESFARGVARAGSIRGDGGPRTRGTTRKTVYNLEVADAHEYFANGVLVRNCHALVYYAQALARLTDVRGEVVRLRPPSEERSPVVDPIHHGIPATDPLASARRATRKRRNWRYA